MGYTSMEMRGGIQRGGRRGMERRGRGIGRVGLEMYEGMEEGSKKLEVRVTVIRSMTGRGEENHLKK